MYLTKDQIKQPKGHLILPSPEVRQQHVFGGTKTIEDLIRAEGLTPTVVNPKGDWTQSATDWDFQRIGEYSDFFQDQETDECFVAAPLNAMQNFLNGTGSPIVNQSRRAAALQSGITRGLGGSLENAFKTFKAIGTFADTDCPSNGPGMTLDQYFQPLPQALFNLEDFLSKGNVPHFIPIPQYLLVDALKYGETIGVVCGRYQFNTSEQIIRASADDNHVITHLRAPSSDKNWFDVQDSENTGGPEKFAPEYNFDYIYLIIVEKKSPPMNNLYKKIGEPAIGLYVPDNGGILLFAVGNDINGKPVEGGSVFKAAGWQYSDAQHVTDWPYPIIGEFTSIPKTN